MTSNTLKLIAIILMVIDHMGYIVEPFSYDIYIIMRLIGRIAFPLFIFVLSESIYFTKSKIKLLNRLFVFSLISEISFNLYFNYLVTNNGIFTSHNIFFTFSIGLILIILIEAIIKNKKIIFPLIFLVLIGFIISELFIDIYSYLFSFISACDYGFIGVISLVILYFEKKSFPNTTSGKNLRIITIMLMCFLLYNISLYFFFAIISLVLIWFYNGEKGKGNKYFFYLFYPVHLLILSLIYIII